MPPAGRAQALALGAAALAIALSFLVVGTQDSLPERPRHREDLSGDFRSYYLPQAEYAGARWAAGEVPLWNPHQGAGGPFLATLQPGALYPPNALHALLPSQTAFVWLALLHLVLATLLAGAFAAALGAGPFGAAAAGIAYAGSLQLVSHIWLPALLYAAAWAPGVLLAVDRCVARPAARSASALALALALPLLAGWPYIVAMVCLAAAFYGTALLAAGVIRERRPPWRALAALAAGVAGGACLAAPLLLPGLELVARSCRALGSVVEAQAVFVPRPHDPGIFLAALRRHGANDGVPSLLVALLALLAVALPGRGRGRCAALLGVALLALLASFPLHAPVYAWLRELPVLGDFRFPYRYRLLSTLALAVTAGVGLDRVLRSLAGRPRLATGVGVAALVLLVGTQSLPAFARSSPFARSVPSARSLTPGFDAAALDAPRSEFARVYWAGRAEKYRDPTGLFAVQDLEPLTLKRTAQMLTFFETGRPRTLLTLNYKGQGDSVASPFYGFLVLPEDDARAAMLDLFAVETIIASEPPAWLSSRYERISEPGAALSVFSNPRALPRAFRAARALREPEDARAALRVLTAPGFDARALVLLDAPPPELLHREGLPLARARGATRIEEYAAERVRLSTRGPDAAVVILSDAHYPGWEARVDGERAPLLRANFGFRGVAVPAGEHAIELRYRPLRWRVGLALAGVAALGLAAAHRLEARRGAGKRARLR